VKLPRLKLRTPVTQILLAGVVMVGGAYLVALWMVGIVLMVTGALLGVDALLRDTAAPRKTVASTHEDILERYRRAK
jgi:hypothetical protein